MVHWVCVTLAGNGIGIVKIKGKGPACRIHLSWTELPPACMWVLAGRNWGGLVTGTPGQKGDERVYSSAEYFILVHRHFCHSFILLPVKIQG